MSETNYGGVDSERLDRIIADVEQWPFPYAAVGFVLKQCRESLRAPRPLDIEAGVRAIDAAFDESPSKVANRRDVLAAFLSWAREQQGGA